MSRPWWGKERWDKTDNPEERPLVKGSLGKRPQLHPHRARSLTTELRERRPHYTFDWSDPPERDAGGALVDLFGTQLEPVVNRLNRLADKSLIEFLQLADIQPAASRPASALVQFEVAPAAESSVFVQPGFRLAAQPATGPGDLVVYETVDDTFVTAATIAKVFVVRGAGHRDVTSENEDPDTSYAPLGEKPELGDALVIGLAGNARITNSLALGIRVAAPPGKPPPVSAGSVSPIPVPVSPVLRWEARVQLGFEPLEVLQDETANLFKSGIVRLRAPVRWEPTSFLDETPHYWIRLRLIHGEFEEPPELSFVRLNMARVHALRTLRDEVLEPLDGPESRRYQLSNQPVISGSLELAVDATPIDEPDQENELRGWEEVADLSEWGPNDRVFLLDPATGVVTFGDGNHGMTIPPGFRNVQALKYKVGSGAEGAVKEDEINTLLNSAPFVTGVSNPLPASGGVDAETSQVAANRGPASIRSGRRAVAVSDYAIWARFAPGAEVAKALAIPGFHPLYPGARIPGVVGVLIVPSPEEEGIPLIPDEASLQAVANYLTSKVAPAGVEIVTTAPKYRFVRTEVGFVADSSADVGTVIRDTIEELNTYLHPLRGGKDADGWPFGGTLYFSELIRWLLTNVKNVRAIPRLRVIVDGVPQAKCRDVPIGPTELLWPESHHVIPVTAEDTP